SAAERTLSAMALAGGVPNSTPGQPWYPVASSQDLVNILEKAAVRITPCSYPLEHEPPVRSGVTLQGPGGIIPRDPLHEDGWDYGGEEDRRIVFYGPACDQLKQGAVRSVEAIYACPGDM